MDKLFIKEVKKDIYKIISELKKCRSSSSLSSRYISLGIDYITICDMCKELNLLESLSDVDNYSYKGHNLIDLDRILIPTIIKDYMKNKDYFLQISSIGEKLIDKYQIPREYRYETLLKNYLTVEDGFDVAESFLKQYNPYIYDVYLKIIENNRLLIKKENYTDDYGLTISLMECQYPYVLINNLNNLTLPFTIVHESGHAAIISKYKNTSIKKIQKYRYYSLYKEVFTYYLELVFTKYLEDNNIYQNDLNLLTKSFDSDMLQLMEKFHKLLKQENVVKEYVNYYCNLGVNMFGKVIAYYYYEMYLEDPEFAKYNIEQFIYHMGDFENIEMLNNFGLNREEILTSKILEKHIERHF